MKFFSTSQIRELDLYTIKHEPIASIDLMERAAKVLCSEFLEHFPHETSICIVAGQGNNGGDALALARLLLKLEKKVTVILIHSKSLSVDCEINRQRLLSTFPTSVKELTDEFIAPTILTNTIIIDGLFGSGLSRPLTGIFAKAVTWINGTSNTVVSIDIPSGLQGDENKLTDKDVIVKADFTFSLQFPKLAYMFAENAAFVGSYSVLNIGIHPEAIEQTCSNFYYLEERDIKTRLKKRSKFSHKGTFGHALLLAGSKGMAGAAVLSSKATLRSGAGLVTVYGPESNRTIVQTAVPETIFKSDTHSDFIAESPDIHKFEAVGIGCGIGTHSKTAKMLRNLLLKLSKPCILDADALNIIGSEKDLLEIIPENSILTPHPKEFERIFGKSNSLYHQMIKAQEAAVQLKLIIILKGAHTLIAMPNSELHFNSTGNSGMATAGSGDVLTGILLGLLTQGYTPNDTAKIGVYLHGLAGNLALKKQSVESLIAGDIIENIGKAYKLLVEK